MTHRLLSGRLSLPGATYFLTLCTINRTPDLTSPRQISVIRSALIHTFSNDHELHCGCVMPDHLHLLFTLGSKLSVGQLMGKLKTLTRPNANAGWVWQRNGFEHRLREHEKEEDYAFYCFMNPYRARIVEMNETWQGWICDRPQRYPFLSHLNADRTPPSAWLAAHDEMTKSVVHH